MSDTLEPMDPRLRARPTGSGQIDDLLRSRARPTSSSRDQLLPVLPVLAPLLPGRGLQRGTVVTVGDDDHGVGGATTLAFALLAEISARGSWCAAVGVADPGVLSLAELGLDLDRLVLAPAPGAHWAEAVAVLLDGVDAVVVSPPGTVRPGLARRLAGRVRERRAVLVVLPRRGGWTEGPEVRLGVDSGAWVGLGRGHGHLQGRRVEVRSTGRRAAARPARATLWLPGPTGAVTAG